MKLLDRKLIPLWTLKLLKAWTDIQPSNIKIHLRSVDTNFELVAVVKSQSGRFFVPEVQSMAMTLSL